MVYTADYCCTNSCHHSSFAAFVDDADGGTHILVLKLCSVYQSFPDPWSKGTKVILRFRSVPSN
jgi:hypothetical protein